MRASDVLKTAATTNNTTISTTDAIIALSNEEDTKASASFIVTKSLTDYGLTKHETIVPVFRIPAIVFTYLLGRNEAIENN